MRTTGPILAIGGITMANESIVHGQPIDWKIPVATAISVGMFSLFEHGWPDGAVALSWVALVTVLFVRMKPGVPAPVEAFNKWIGYATS
jgi:hypothetical protein